MNYDKIGAAISYLRKRAGYTQKELAERIGISDKAVSKWERGITLPDVSCLTKLSILLDTDTDSLLAGDIINHDHGWCGFLVLDENPHGIKLDTVIYDKPLVYYLLSYFILVGIKYIVVDCSNKDKDILQSELKNGSDLGIDIKFYRDLPKNEAFNGYSNVMAVFGREFIFGVDQTRFFNKAMVNKERTTILSLPRKTTGAAPGIHFDNEKRIVDYDNSDRVVTQYDYYEIPVVFCPKNKLPTIYSDGTVSFSGDDVLYTEVLDRGFIEMSINSWDDVSVASDLVKLVQKTCGMEIYCIEEIAWRRGLISTDKLRELGENSSDSSYGEYILSLAE